MGPTDSEIEARYQAIVAENQAYQARRAGSSSAAALPPGPAPESSVQPVRPRFVDAPITRSVRGQELLARHREAERQAELHAQDREIRLYNILPAEARPAFLLDRDPDAVDADPEMLRRRMRQADAEFHATAGEALDRINRHIYGE